MTSVGPNGPARATALTLLSGVLIYKAADLRRKGYTECVLHSYILTNSENIHRNNSSNAVHLTQLINHYNPYFLYLKLLEMCFGKSGLKCD